MLFFYTQNCMASEIIKKTIDGIRYGIWQGLSTEKDYAYVTSPESGRYTGEINIPSFIYYEGKEYCVKEIGYLSFYFSTVSKVTIPNSIKEIGIQAFAQCSNLSELIIPSSVDKIGEAAFQGCNIKLVIEGTNDEDINWSKTLKNLKETSTIYAYKSQLKNIGSSFKGQKNDLGAPYWVKCWNTYLRGIRFSVHENEYYTKKYSLEKITVDEKAIDYKKDSTYFIKGLDISVFNYEGHDTNIDICYKDKDSNIKYQYFKYLRPAPSIYFNIRDYEDFDKIIARIEVNGDETARPKEATVQIYDNNYYRYEGTANFTDTQAKVIINNLMPITFYKEPKCTITFEDDEGNKCERTYRDKGSYNTSAYPCEKINIEEIKPNSISVSSFYKILSDKINITKAVIYLNEDERELTTENKTYLFKGLHPNSSYEIKVSLYCKHNRKEERIGGKSISFKTSELELTTEAPRVVTNTSALVSAKTNIGEEEENVGFEWRKTDAPDVVVSKMGNGHIYNGSLEGKINNLSPSSYYKVRPFYKTNNNNLYYGEWIGFDPSDFSYFEPTVHTYARVSVDGTSAKLKGVALQGTDDITEQGFEYWADNITRSSTTTTKQTVLATGQSMEAELNDLLPNVTYNYRAYAKTAKGTTYGETQQFKTPVISGIEDAASTTEDNINICVKSKDGVQIAVNGTNEECLYRINHIFGASIAFGQIKADGEWHTVSNTKLPSGIYIVSVSNNKYNKAVKVIVK